jgi:hypothetical protein
MPVPRTWLKTCACILVRPKTTVSQLHQLLRAIKTCPRSMKDIVESNLYTCLQILENHDDRDIRLEAKAVRMWLLDQVRTQ